MKTTYLIVGDNNYWYALTTPVTEKELQAELKDLTKRMKAGEYHFNDFKETPSELYAYPVKTNTPLIFKTKL